MISSMQMFQLWPRTARGHSFFGQKGVGKRKDEHSRVQKIIYSQKYIYFVENVHLNLKLNHQNLNAFMTSANKQRSKLDSGYFCSVFYSSFSSFFIIVNCYYLFSKRTKSNVDHFGSAYLVHWRARTLTYSPHSLLPMPFAGNELHTKNRTKNK